MLTAKLVMVAFNYDFVFQKYNSKVERRNSDYIPETRYASLRSPNGNVFMHGHGHSGHTGHTGHTGHSAHSAHHHYSHVVEERPHTIPRNSYMQKDSEKERDRDYKSSRNKYTGGFIIIYYKLAFPE